MNISFNYSFASVLFAFCTYTVEYTSIFSILEQETTLQINNNVNIINIRARALEHNESSQSWI